MSTRVALALVLSMAWTGCSDPEPGPRQVLFGGDRPAELEAPPTLVDGTRYPLIVVLHGFGADGFGQSAYLGTTNLARAGEALVIAPDGTQNSDGRRFWNADPACCDFENQGPDDVAYLGGLIDEITAAWPVDPGQVFVIGHSNGGFMAYRLACERADAVAAIVSIAGLAASNAAGCTPTRPVAVMQLHGTSDAVVPYQGGGSGIGAVGASGSVTQWATHNGCGATRTAGTAVDLEVNALGNETQPQLTDGCPADGQAELWEMAGVGHVPAWGPTFTSTMLAWFLDHARS